jgi:predicted KAP-like P-loop ATPase
MELGKLSDKHADEERPKAEALIRHDDLIGLEDLVLSKVRNAAADESLLKCPKLPEILTFWKDLAGEAEPIAWISTMGRDDHN